MRRCDKYTLSMRPSRCKSHPHNVFPYFCQIIFMTIIHVCIVNGIFTSLSMYYTWHFIFLQFIVVFEILEGPSLN